VATLPPILTAEEAAALIQDNQTVSFSGFAGAGSPKVIPGAIAKRAEAEHAAGRPFRIGVLTGASTGPTVDGVLAKADAISFRTPYQSDSNLRKAINEGRTRFVDMHLSALAQAVRYGFMGKVNWAIIEAADVTRGGGVVLTTGVGASPTFANQADKILIELNDWHSPDLLGMHDLFEPKDPPSRREIAIYDAADRIGSPIMVVDRRKVVGIVKTNVPEEAAAFPAPTAVTKRIGENVAEFLSSELKLGRIPRNFLPLQSGVGDTANAVLGCLGANPAVPAFQMFTEVVQDSVLDLIDAGRCRFASTCSLTLSTEANKRFLANLDRYRDRIVLRPQEMSNNPELVRRLGIISMNTALELDLDGNINSTHVMGRQLMNGIGGSGDFTRNAYLSIFSCASVAKGGKISTVVPLVSHTDHSEHSVSVVVTEQGVADLRGKDPSERA
jgi:propionyl-CoA:succinyl-CoA transferase